ncbi:MAG: hypothetical protein QOI95_2356 [Acidimicrobiaceae bacterium]|jgi:hypothetical protein
MPEHPSLIDEAHITDELFGVTNVPNAVWIDEDGVIVRPAEPANIERSALRDRDIPEGLPERIRDMLAEVKEIRDDSDAYRSAITDWVEHGAESRYALSADEVVARSQPRGREQAEAAACFELGHHFHQAGDHDGAVHWWREAHRLDPNNWTYKRQAWSLASTAPGEPSDLMQGPNDLYEGNWLDDVKAIGGGANYYTPFEA